MTETRTALARLVPFPDGFRWFVDHCPLCGRRHVHDGGPLLGDPRSPVYLGRRTPHCHGAGTYQLVEAPRGIRRP